MIDLRTPRPSDYHYISHTWGVEAKRYRGPRQSKRMAKTKAEANANALLLDPGARWAVLVEAKNTNRILGFACAKDGCLHWVSVRRPLRRRGLAKLMIGAVAPSPVEYSATTPHVERWPLKEQMTFNPRALPFPPKSSSVTEEGWCGSTRSSKTGSRTAEARS